MNMEVHVPEVKGRSDLRIQSLSAEHGILEVSGESGPAVGERIELIPGYGDFTTVLHDRFHCLRGRPTRSCLAFGGARPIGVALGLPRKLPR